MSFPVLYMGPRVARISVSVAHRHHRYGVTGVLHDVPVYFTRQLLLVLTAPIHEGMSRLS